MKHQTDKILLAAFLLTLFTYAAVLAAFIQYGGNNSEAPRLILLLRQFHLWLALGFHAVPAFCIQLLAARSAKRKWLAAVHSVLLAGWLVFCLYNWAGAAGWDTLGWALLLWGTFAPAAGCALAWAAYGLGQLRQRRAVA